jgi:alginate O-acetyltransferase complex protein AlgI
MSFEDKPFLTLLIVTWFCWRVLRENEQQVLRLFVAASILFYSYQHLILLPILLGYCIVDWWIGIQIESREASKKWLSLGVFLNLLVLGLAKYLPLIINTIHELSGVWVLPESRIQPDRWLPPFGISFYAFTGIAYLVEVHRKVTPAEQSLLRYTASAIFFPHLVAGPILRPNEFLEKLRPGKMPCEPEAILEAGWLISRGYFKKLVIADPIGIAIDPFFAHVHDETTLGVWALPFVYLYALQIYFDFSGYTDLARGIGLLFGYRWPENFNLPYLATSITVFWQRWHMTLSRFLRDYLYFTLGGNRGSKLKTYRNLFLTMVLGGLWHGAAWSFLIWGALHGMFLIIHRLWMQTSLASKLKDQLIWRFVSWFLTFHAVCLAWCFFRLTHFHDSLICIEKCFHSDLKVTSSIQDGSLYLPFLIYFMGLCLHRSQRAFSSFFAMGLQIGLIVSFGFLSWLMMPTGPKSPFIYFQF